MNWYKISQEIAERVDLSVVTPEQWKQINDRMVAIGYEFRGWEDTKRIFERLNKTTGGLPEDHTKVFEAVINKKEYIVQKPKQETINIFNRAIRRFGLTNNIKECGYILPNGAMLDFSGKKVGGWAGHRQLDHSEINDILPTSEFVSLGAIRYFPEQPGVDIRAKPTQKQLGIIENDINNSGNGYVIEILDMQKGRFHQQYDPGTKGSKIMNDISRFYSGTSKLASKEKWHKQASKEFHYFGQCNKVRCDNAGENNWQNMIQKHQKVSPDEFINKCSIEELLESGETLQEMISDDHDSYFAKSWWGDKPCYYLMTKGFEFIFLPQQNKQAGRQKYHKDVPKTSQGGDCYHVAGTYLMDNARNNPNLILVHGEVSGQGRIAGIRYGHAWVEDGEMVIDNSNGRNLKIPKMIYYSIGNIEPDKTFRYNMEQMRRKILDSGHWGPWDLKTKY